jgi:hypothetical protein
MSDEKIDFDPIDPSKDPRRWERMVARTTSRALAARARTGMPPSTSAELARLSWPLTAAAAVIAAVALFVASAAGPTSTSGPLTADSMSEWANQGTIPSGVDLVALTGDTR